MDDEPLALQLLENKLQAFEEVEIVKTFSNPLVLLEEAQDLSFNTAFLDVDMPGLNGIELAEHILSTQPSVQIVFTTAYHEYAVQAFELDSLDYVVKPISNDRLQQTVLRVCDQLKLRGEAATAGKPLLRIYSFPDFTVYSGEEEIKWKTTKVKELFAYLYTYHGISIHRDTLIDTLWPNTEYGKAKIQLHTALSHLRKSLQGAGQKKPISFANQGYRLKLEHFFCGASHMQQLAQRDVTAENITDCEHAVDIYFGNYMEQEGYSWSHVREKELQASMTQLLDKMIDYFSKTNMLPKKENCLLCALRINPYSEQALQALLKHYIETGNRTDAVTAFHSFRQTIEDEMGISPTKSTLSLFEEVLLSDQLQ